MGGGSDGVVTHYTFRVIIAGELALLGGAGRRGVKGKASVTFGKNNIHRLHVRLVPLEG